MYADSLDGVSGFPGIGDMLPIALKRQYYFLEKHKKYKSYFRTKTFKKNAVVLFGYSVSKSILNDKTGSFSSYLGWSLLEPLLGRGILLEDGDLHFKYRSLLHDSFSKISKEFLYPLIYRVTAQHLENWKKNRLIPIYRNLKKISFDVIFSLVFGGNEKFDIKEDLENCFYDLLNAQLSVIRVDNHIFSYGKGMSARRKLHAYCHENINKISTGLESESILSNIIKFNEEGNFNFTNDEIVSLILQILFAGYETTAKLGTYIILLLNNSPEYYNKINFYKHKISDDLECLEYFEKNKFLDYVLWEVERLYPPIYIIPRGLNRDYTVNEDMIIPKDWLVYISISITHRLESDYKFPDQFLPERFARDNKANKLIGFGSGIHSCLGKELAKLEIKVLIMLLMEKFDLSIWPRKRNYTSSINRNSFVKNSSLIVECR